MKNNSVAILDFGSSKITCMLANKVSDGGDFIIKAVGRSNYNGFDDKGWYEPDTIKKAVFDAITQVENKTETKIKEIYVGVPGAFCAVASSESSITFRSKKKLDNQARRISSIVAPIWHLLVANQSTLFLMVASNVSTLLATSQQKYPHWYLFPS